MNNFYLIIFLLYTLSLAGIQTKKESLVIPAPDSLVVGGTVTIGSTPTTLVPVWIMVKDLDETGLINNKIKQARMDSLSVEYADSSRAAHVSDTCLNCPGGSNTVVLGTTGQITVAESNDTFTVSLYQPPDILTFTNNKLTNYVGQTITALTTSWTLTGNTITGQTHTDVSPDPDIADREHAFTGLSITTDKTYKLRITDGVTVDSAYTYAYFYIAKFTGTTAMSAPSEAAIEGGTASWVRDITSSRTLSSTAIAGGGNYVYYGYPADWGDVQIYVNGFSSTWSKTTVSITNGYGDTQNYYVYTSPTTIVGTIYVSAVAI